MTPQATPQTAPKLKKNDDAAQRLLRDAARHAAERAREDALRAALLMGPRP